MFNFLGFPRFSSLGFRPQLVGNPQFPYPALSQMRQVRAVWEDQQAAQYAFLRSASGLATRRCPGAFPTPADASYDESPSLSPLVPSRDSRRLAIEGPPDPEGSPVVHDAGVDGNPPPPPVIIAGPPMLLRAEGRPPLERRLSLPVGGQPPLRADGPPPAAVPRVSLGDRLSTSARAFAVRVQQVWHQTIYRDIPAPAPVELTEAQQREEQFKRNISVAILTALILATSNLWVFRVGSDPVMPCNLTLVRNIIAAMDAGSTFYQALTDQMQQAPLNRRQAWLARFIITRYFESQRIIQRSFSNLMDFFSSGMEYLRDEENLDQAILDVFEDINGYLGAYTAGIGEFIRQNPDQPLRPFQEKIQQHTTQWQRRLNGTNRPVVFRAFFSAIFRAIPHDFTYFNGLTSSRIQIVHFTGEFLEAAIGQTIGRVFTRSIIWILKFLAQYHFSFLNAESIRAFLLLQENQDLIASCSRQLIDRIPTLFRPQPTAAGGGAEAVPAPVAAVPPAPPVAAPVHAPVAAEPPAPRAVAPAAPRTNAERIADRAAESLRLFLHVLHYSRHPLSPPLENNAHYAVDHETMRTARRGLRDLTRRINLISAWIFWFRGQGFHFERSVAEQLISVRDQLHRDRVILRAGGIFETPQEEGQRPDVYDDYNPAQALSNVLDRLFEQYVPQHLTYDQTRQRLEGALPRWTPSIVTCVGASLASSYDIRGRVLGDLGATAARYSAGYLRVRAAVATARRVGGSIGRPFVALAALGLGLVRRAEPIAQPPPPAEPQPPPAAPPQPLNPRDFMNWPQLRGELVDLSTHGLYNAIENNPQVIEALLIGLMKGFSYLTDAQIRAESLRRRGRRAVPAPVPVPAV